jgi:hypothetical protein
VRPARGKGSLIWAPLRAMGPLIGDGLVRVSMIDLKGGITADVLHAAITLAAQVAVIATERPDGEPLLLGWGAPPHGGGGRCAGAPVMPF